MNIVLIADRSFAVRERLMLQRLEIGLTDEAGRVLHALPFASLPDDLPTLCSPAIGYNDEGFWFSRATRANELLRVLGAELGEAEASIDVIHAFGGRSWAIAAALARECGAPLVLEVWRTTLVSRAARLATRPEGVRVAFSAPSMPLGERLREAIASGGGSDELTPVRVAPWGVHAGPAREARDGGVAPASDPVAPARPSIAVLASGRQPEALTPIIEAMTRLGDRTARPLVLFDADTVRRARLWKRFGAAGIEDMAVLVDEMEARREPVLRADMLLRPEALGRHHSLTLDAMAHGLPVVSVPDPDVGWLNPADGVVVLDRPTPDAWFDAIARLLDDPGERARLGALGTSYAGAHHRVAGQVGALVSLYTDLTSVEPALTAGEPIT